MINGGTFAMPFEHTPNKSKKEVQTLYFQRQNNHYMMVFFKKKTHQKTRMHLLLRFVFPKKKTNTFYFLKNKAKKFFFQK
jgi:hypothetical protein